MNNGIVTICISGLLSLNLLFAQEKGTSIFGIDRYKRPTPATSGIQSNTTTQASSVRTKKTNARRFLFVLDHSASMSNPQEELRNSELQKALKNLPLNAEYQVILFGPGTVFAEPGWSARHDKNMHFEVTGPNRRKYLFKPFRGVNDWSFEGNPTDLPKAKWLRVSSQTIRKTLASLDTFEKFYGTDWGIGLDTAHLMSPPPDVIFFMSDGSGGNAPKPILETNKKYGSPEINTYAMQTTMGARQFFEIATKTGGEFMIITRDGTAVKVTDPNKVGF